MKKLCLATATLLTATMLTAGHKAEFIATAMAEGVSREDAERLAAEAGH